MALQVGSFASQAQTAYTNPFQQRVEDQQGRKSEEKDNESARAETRVQGSSAAESQKAGLVRAAAQEREEETGQNSNPQQRGSVLDISV